MTYRISSQKEKVIRTSLRITFFYALFLLFSNISSAQTYYFDFHGVAEGLAQNKVYTVKQDNNGYIWLGTETGISLFDGNEFINFYVDDGIAVGGVKTIHIAEDGKVWFGHYGGGISLYDGESFINYPFKDYISGDITSIFEGNPGELWVTTYGDGLYVIKNPNELDTTKIEYDHFVGRQLGDRLISGIRAPDGSIYIITYLSVKKYNEETATFENYRPEGLTSYFNVTCMHFDSKGDAWYGTYNGGLYRFSAEKGEFLVYDTRDGLAHNWISTITEDSNGNIWVGTFGGGITKFLGDEFITYNNSNGFLDEKINKIIEDVEGNILIATYDHGLSIFKGDHFLSYGTEDGLINHQVWAVQQDSKERIWFGTNLGVSVFDQKEKAFIHYNQSTNAIGDHIRYIVEDMEKNIWVGSLDGGVLQYDFSTQRFVYNPSINRYIRSNNRVSAMTVDIKNQLWIGTFDGIVYYNINTKEHKSYSQIDGLSGNDITSLYADKKGYVWVGIRDMGLNKISDYTISKVSFEENLTPNCFAEDSKGNIWFGTSTKGVMVCDGDSIIKVIDQNDGLLSNLITQIEVDKNDNVFIGTNQGLNKITPDGNIMTYTKRSGFTGIEAKPNASYVDTDGNLWFGTVEGVVKYIPERDLSKPVQPITHISGLKVNFEDHPLIDGHIFNFYENSMIFDYNSICLANPDAVQYQIMLEGADRDWRPVTEQTTANYSSLRPNEYIFKVRAKNSSGIWNEEPITYSFTIKPPFYQTSWFIISVLVVVAALIITYIKIRERNLIKEKKILEEKVAERTAELAQKNKDITDSIRYAQRIQMAVLPPEVPLKDCFVLFKPKDIVSGDFYWFESVDDIDLLAAVDCTGHGVPGAFLSILGHNLLTKIVREYGIIEPGEILQKLNEELLKSLHQKVDSDARIVNDGMDLALISYNKKTNELSFSGAYNPLFFVRDGELEETKANRFAIGRSMTKEEKKFESHTHKVKKGDTFYVFSDGYADQFGGPDNRKFRKKNMKDLIISIQDKDMDTQANLMNEAFEEWKGANDQIDDIVIIGLRI